MKTQELSNTKAENANTMHENNKMILNSAPMPFFKKLKWLPPLAFAAVLWSCNNSDQLVQQYKSLHEHDSIMALENQAQDSTIKGYVHYVNEIQSNLDEIN